MPYAITDSQNSHILLFDNKILKSVMLSSYKKLQQMHKITNAVYLILPEYVNKLM